MSGLAFADPPRESQAAFRALLGAMARPGTVLRCGASLKPPPPLQPAAAAAILTLADFETPVFLAPSFAASDAAVFLRFHTGAPFASSPDKAAFALVDAEADPFDLTSFHPGAPDYPDRSTTVVLQLRSLARGQLLWLAGPGIRGDATLRADPLPRGFREQWQANAAAFPLGVDLILAAGDEVAALPRSTRITGGG
jgi:alpha-D-ribose 1-methylphosphonate 5-triphosphate synthase subunit PhnH